MNRPLRKMTFHCVLMASACLILWAPNSSKAQDHVVVTQGDCSEGNTPCTTILRQSGANAPQLDVEGGPPFGPGQVAIVSSGAMVGFQDKAAMVKNEPYQAQAVTEMKQTLADGSHIVQTTTATVARDGDGRTVRIQKLSTMGPWRSAGSSEKDSQTLTTIFDPIANEHIDYTSDTKVAHVLPMPPLPPGANADAAGGFTVSAPVPLGNAESGFIGSGSSPAGVMAQGFAVQPRTISPQASNGIEPKTESLGTKTIEGIQAAGTRSTTTIPAGAIGNDKALIITRETWYSPKLKLVIQSTQNDPRFGQTTYTLKNVQLGSPDETLFQVPPDYTIDKVVPRLMKAPPQ
ncbi:MAG TPA: hypothetical protein VGM27_11300 [Acidobacteriaceae bacterium]